MILFYKYDRVKSHTRVSRKIYRKKAGEPHQLIYCFYNDVEFICVSDTKLNGEFNKNLLIYQRYFKCCLFKKLRVYSVPMAFLVNKEMQIRH